jgi:hypothetical protein
MMAATARPRKRIRRPPSSAMVRVTFGDGAAKPIDRGHHKGAAKTDVIEHRRQTGPGGSRRS